MKNISLILNVVLLIAVIVLYVKVFNNNGSGNGSFKYNPGDSTSVGHLPIAYINIDSLLINYTFAKEANENLMKKQENSRLDLNTQARQLQSEMGEFQRKLENNAFLSRERAEKEQNRLLKKEQELQQMNGILTQQLVEAQQKMSEELRDTINSFLKEYNKDKKYEIILSNTASDNIMITNEGYDITSEIIELLNKRYEKKK